MARDGALYRYTACLIMWGFVAHLESILPDQLGLVYRMGTVPESAIDWCSFDRWKRFPGSDRRCSSFERSVRAVRC